MITTDYQHHSNLAFISVSGGGNVVHESSSSEGKRATYYHQVMIIFSSSGSFQTHKFEFVHKKREMSIISSTISFTQK